jgi:hypothetical protein
MLAEDNSSDVSDSLNKNLDPIGKTHIPIGIPNTLDTLKTFVEAEGCFSPGFGSYGIYFWIFDHETGTLTAPTMKHVKCEHGLYDAGYPIPWCVWKYKDVEVKTEICEIQKQLPKGEIYIVGTRIYLKNIGNNNRAISLYLVLRPLGPAGGSVNKIDVSEDDCALMVDGHIAVVAETKPETIGVMSSDSIGKIAFTGGMPSDKIASSEIGDCSGAMRFDLIVDKTEKMLEFVCPVLPGRYAVRHRWTDLGQDALADTAELNSSDNGILQTDPGLEYYKQIHVSELFDETTDYWQKMLSKVKINLPDHRWGQGMVAMLSHAGISMNEGAPDVAVINYNVFNRDGMYVANMMQKSGLFDLASQALDYFLSHPFNGRAFPEADNPGQILWSLGQQWLFTRDKDWLKRVYPSVQKLCGMIKYYRTTPEPHWVDMGSLEFGESLPPEKRLELKSGSCDGYHPEYTEAFDIAGLRISAILAKAMRRSDDTDEWKNLADEFSRIYDERFGQNLGKDYGNYSVLWPCMLYPLSTGKAYEQFRNIGAKRSQSWRYFPLATAHQGLLAGNREAGYGTVALHLDEEQMQGWYAFDEGGGSSSGGWHRSRTNWTRNVDKPGANMSVAMPHGWAISELWLLMRDCLLFEDDNDRIVLLAGIPPEWFSKPMEVKGMETYYGTCSFEWIPRDNGAVLRILGTASPPNGFVLRLPNELNARVILEGKNINLELDGSSILPTGAKESYIRFN